MPAETPPPATLLSVTPYLPAVDVVKSAEFYTTMLGFEVAHQEGTAFILLKCGEVQIGLARAGAGFTPGACLIMVSKGIDELYARCQAAGGTIASPLAGKPWGLRMFILEDPNGNKLDIGEPG